MELSQENEGFSEPLSGIVGAPKELNLESLRAPSVLKVEDLRSSDRRDSLEKPRSSRDMVRADESGTEGANLEFPKGILRRISVKSPEDGTYNLKKHIKKIY